MIGKVTLGTGFQGLQTYLMTGRDGRQLDRVAWVASRNLMTDEPELATRIMEATAQRSVRVQRPVYHLMINIPPEESFSREAMLQIADRTLQDLGLDEHQVLIVAHNDTNHSHIHLMVNRVHPETGRAWHTGHDYARIEKSLRRQERELGLREVPGRHFALPGQERHRGIELSSGERRFYDRTGERSFGQHVREVTRPDLREARSWAGLHHRLADYGLQFEKRGRGLVITDGEHRVKASFVDRKSSLPQLQKRLGPYQAASRDLILTGKSERWKDIRAIRRVAEGFVRHRDAAHHARVEAAKRFRQQDAKEETLRLERQVDAVSNELDQHLKQVFRDPTAARGHFDDLERSRGNSTAVQELASSPDRFGKLRGRGGPLPSAERQDAVRVARYAARTGRDLADSRRTLADHIAHRRSAAKGAKLAKTVRRTKRVAPKLPSRAVLARSAAKLVNRLGWEIVARAIPSPHLQLLRLTLSLSRRAMQVSQDLGRSIDR